MGLNLQEHAQAMHDCSKVHKEQMWKENKNRDCNPNGVAIMRSGVSWGLPLDPIAPLLDRLFYENGKTWEGHPSSCEAGLAMSLEALFNMRGSHTPVHDMIRKVEVDKGAPWPHDGDRLLAVVWMSELYYVSKGDTDWDDVDPPPGFTEVHALKTDFEDNPGSQVKEAMMTIVVQDDLCGGVDWAVICEGFRFDDGGILVWDAPVIVTSTDPCCQRHYEQAREISGVNTIAPFFKLEAAYTNKE